MWSDIHIGTTLALYTNDIGTISHIGTSAPHIGTRTSYWYRPNMTVFYRRLSLPYGSLQHSVIRHFASVSVTLFSRCIRLNVCSSVCPEYFCQQVQTILGPFYNQVSQSQYYCYFIAASVHCHRLQISTSPCLFNRLVMFWYDYSFCHIAQTILGQCAIYFIYLTYGHRTFIFIRPNMIAWVITVYISVCPLSDDCNFQPISCKFGTDVWNLKGKYLFIDDKNWMRVSPIWTQFTPNWQLY